MDLFELKEEKERVILVGVATRENEDVQDSLDELEELVETAGAQTVGRVVQSREGIHPGYYVGTGKLEEIQMAVRALDATGIVCDDELSPSQMNNLERELECKVMDRTVVILDIFASRAKTSEGKIQVELAQLNYALPRLRGKGQSLSRLGGGIGTRGPGESKLESDRRHIRRRIYALEETLRQIEKRRNAQRTRRKKDGVISVAIVGYTNAGKSTLMNYLTSAGVLAEDKLFATLDPTARKLTLPNGQAVMLIDTVGLVRRLPHHLVEAFKSTLEEARDADLILNVCDASSAECADHIEVTENLLRELGAEHTPVITVMNKCDLIPSIYDVVTMGKTVCISAKTGEGVENLLTEMEKALSRKRMRATLLIPFDKGGILAEIRQNGQVLSEEYLPEGTRAEVVAEANDLEKYKPYFV